MAFLSNWLSFGVLPLLALPFLTGRYLVRLHGDGYRIASCTMCLTTIMALYLMAVPPADPRRDLDAKLTRAFWPLVFLYPVGALSGIRREPLA